VPKVLPRPPVDHAGPGAGLAGWREGWVGPGGGPGFAASRDGRRLRGGQGIRRRMPSAGARWIRLS